MDPALNNTNNNNSEEMRTKPEETCGGDTGFYERTQATLTKDQTIKMEQVYENMH